MSNTQQTEIKPIVILILPYYKYLKILGKKIISGGSNSLNIVIIVNVIFNYSFIIQKISSR